MKPDDLKKLSKNPDFIEGIYNYCDRWCERCAFTKRCMNYSMEEDPDEESKDATNIKFWNKIAENLHTAIELLKEAAEAQGIDITNILFAEKDVAEERTLRKKISAKHCAKESKKYSAIALEWLESHHNLFVEKQNELNKQIEMGCDPEELKSNADEIKNSIDVIHWYLFFIHVKTMRALHGKLEFKDDDPDLPSDSDGSAKIALIGCDRTLGSWAMLLNLFPEEEDSIIEILAKLEKIRRLLEREFPKARAFHRPGFDD
jgi:hypothetical protein